MRKKFLLMTFLTLLFTAMGTSVLRAQGNVAKVGDTEYATIDEAIAAWTNGKTLTLLADVTLSDVIQLSSQEHHYLEVGEFTMTAASGKNAIEIKSYGRSNRSESGALTITADDTNPGGIEAASKSCIYYKYDATLANDQYDRPIIYIIGGVFGSSSYSGISSTGHSSAQDKCATFNISGGIFNCSLNLTKTKLITSGGTFHGSVSCTGGSTSTRLISGGTFKSFGFMTADDNNTKFWIGTSMGNSNVGTHIDDNGYLVVGGPVVTEAGETYEASTANYSGWDSKLKYSSAKDNGLYYTSVEEALADNNKTTGSVTVYVDELDMTGISYKGTIVVPKGSTITITNAPATLVVKDEEGNVLEHDANGSYTAPDFSGEGTETSPYIIADIDDLNNLRNKVNEGETYDGKYFELTSDITLTDAWTPIGNGARSSKTYTGYSFKGTFDGGNKTISGLTITSTSGADAAIGLFGIVDGGTVKNLNLTDVNINVASSNLAGAAIGMMLKGATADYITVSGTIIGHDGVGGIVGRLIIEGTISNCINDASVTSSYGGIGGIVGKAYYEDDANTSTFASVIKCTNNGTITAPMYVGGIVGLARANVTECVNNGAVVGGTQTGGIIGQLIAAGEVSANENKAKISGTNHLGGIIGDYSQSNAYTYYNVSIANNINRGEVSATQCAAIMGCNNIDGFTAMIATGNVSYYYVEGLELFGNPEDMVIDETNKFIIPVAQVGEQTFYTFDEAAAAAQDGSEIILLANIEGDITVPANVTLNGNGFAISGGIYAEGDITFAGVTTAADFDANVVNTEVNIPAGASLQLTGSARLVIGHGATFNITGTIEDAKTADKATLVPSLKIAAGASITGNGVIFNVNNAYIVANANTTSKNSNANGTLDFNINNSIWEQTGVLAFYVPTSGMDPVVNFELKNSVLTTTSHLVFSVTKGEIVIDNSLVNQGTSRQIENRSTMTVKNGSVVNGAVATSSNAKNPGTLIVDNATYAVTGEFSGSDLGTGTLIVNKTANFSAGSITKANIQIDVTGMNAGDEVKITTNLTNHAGTIEVINNNMLDAKIVDGKIVIVERTLQGEGTEANPYLINNISDLEFFRDYVNAGNNYAGKYVKLTADIDLNNEEWTPIGNDINKFQGYFDGNEKTISNLKVTGNTRYKGFFGYIKGTGMSATTTPSVKDLTLDGVNVNVEGDGYYVGGLAGQAYTCNITNVTVKGNVSGKRYVGGIVGHVYTYFKDCHFIGNASCSFDALGGIAGAGDCRAYDCSVIGDITGPNWVGGIVGNGQEGTSAVGCYVKGDVKTSTNYYFGVGGIAGVAGHGYSSSEFKNNYFNGEVYLEGEKVPAMIIGIVNAENNETIYATIEGNSWNTAYYDVNIPVYVTAEAPQNGTKENWIASASEELTKPRNNNLIMLESDLQYVTEEDYVIMPFSEVTEEQVEQALINNAVAKIGETTYTTLQKALDAAVAGTGNVTVEIIKDIDLTNVDWNPVTVSAPGYPVVTVEGNNKTITGLNDMLFAGTWAGNSGLIIKNLTIKESNIVHDENDTAGTIGVGAFIGYPQASATITLYNCRLKNSTVNGGHWTGGLIGMAGGYNGNDGPVFMNLTIEGCSVTGSTITGKGSCGGIIGHGSCAAWTAVNIQNTTVSGNTVTSTGSSTNKAGAVMGTIGAAGQPTTANGVTMTGGAMVAATVSGNTVKSGGTVITTIYGRQGTETGILELNGGSYDNYPIEQNVAYAKPAAGLMIEQNEYGTYGLVPDPAYGKVAMIGETYYETLQDAVDVGGEVKVIANITLDQTVTVAADKTVVLDLNGKTISTSAEETSYAINNLGTLTLKDSSEGKTGAVNARGIYNGYDENGNHVASAKIIVESGTYNAKGTNGGAAIFNYGIAEINGGTFTSIGGYSLSNQSGSSITVADGVTANNGIYISNGVLTINGGDIDGNRSGCHVVYAWNSTVTINGGDFYNNNSGNATIMAAGTTQMTIKGGIFGIKDGRVPGNANTWTSCLTDTQNSATMIVIGGTFNGGFRVQNGTTMTIEGGSFNDCFGSGYNIYGTATVKGGTFTDNAAITFARNYLADGFKLEENADGTYGVVPFVEKSYEINEETTLAQAIAQAKEDGAEIVTYTIYGAATLETGLSHGIVDFGGEEGYITIQGANVNTRSEDSFTITGGGVPDIKGVTFKDLTFYDEGTYLPTANEFMYQNFIDCTFENVKFEDGIRLSGNCTIKDCEVNANTTNEYAIWLDEGEFEITGTEVEAGNDAYGMIKSDEADKITIKDNTFTYLGKVNKEALNTNGATIIAEDNTFIDCAKGIVPADKVNYTADGTTQITDAIIAVDNEIIIYVAKIGNVKYQSLAEAATAAQDGETIELLWAEGHAPIAMAATIVNNKTVTIKGTADVDWDKGWLYVGRNGEGDGKLIFNEANLTSKSVGVNGNGIGLNVSCKKDGSNTTNDGKVEIINSNIQLDYLIGKGDIKLDNSTLNVYEGFAVGARPASETGGVQHTVTMDITNGSKVIVKNHNGQGLGYESNGIMNIDATSTFETTQSFLITAKGTMNVNGGNVKTVGTLTNNGAVNVTGNASMNVNTLTGNAINFTNVTIANANIGGAVNAFGTNNFTGETNIEGILSVGYNGSPAEQVVVNITGNFNGGNVLIGSSNDNVLNVGNAESTETTAYFSQLGAFGDVNIVNAGVTYGYTFIRNDFNVTNSTMAINGGVNTYFSGNAKVVVDNSSWNLSGHANIGSYGGPDSKGNADVTLKNGSSMTATNLGVEQYDGKTVILTLKDSSTLTATNLSNTGSIVLAGKEAKITSNELTGTNNVPTTNIEEYKVVYENGVYKVVQKVYVAQIGENKYESLQEAIEAAQNDETITLLVDVEQADGVIIDSKNIVVDLNEKTFTVTEGANTNNRNFKITGTSVVTIKNGTMVADGEYSSGAYGTVRTEGKAEVTLTGLKLYNYRGNGLNIKALGGTTVDIEDTEIYSQYGGGIEAAGGTITLAETVKVEQKGMYTAPYNSMAISVNCEGLVTVNGGTYSTECITAEEANNQGTSHGPWVVGVLNSGGTLIINGGTFSNDNFGDNSLATAARGAVLADTKANVQINGGTFNALKAIIDIQNNLGDQNNNPSALLSGGTFSADPRISASYGSNLIVVAQGYSVVENDGTYSVVEDQVAKIGDVTYKLLHEAFNAAQDGDEIVVLEDITYTKANGYVNGEYIDGLVYTGDKSFTVDFNGHTITDNGDINDYLVYLKNTGVKENEITFKNGKIAIKAERTNTAWAAITVGANSATYKTTLNLDNMEVVNGNPNEANNQVIRTRNGATVNLNKDTFVTSNGTSYGVVAETGSTVNIKSGAKVFHTNSGTTGGDLVYTAVSGNGTINIYDGATIESDNYAIHNMTSGNTVINIYGGTIKADEVAVHVATNGGVGESAVANISDGIFTGLLETYTNAASIVITGGTFSVDPTAYCADGYEAEQIDNNKWMVIQVSGTQTRSLQAGWNWFSSYVDLSQEGGLLKLQTALGESGLAIKGQTENQSVQYVKIGVVEGEEIYAWTGNQNWNPYSNKMYMIKTSKAMSAEEFGINGDFIDYENTTIALFQGWNWISYPLNEPALIKEALAALNPTEGDQIKFRGNTYAEYFNGEWYPEDFVFMPGEGYMYKAESPNSFVYTKGTTNVRATNKTTENNNWMAQTSEYANNMTITAMLSIDGEVVNDNYEIAAFANGECRGSARPIYIEKFDAYILFMTVYGEEVEDLTFRYYDVNYGTEYELDNRVVYSNDASLGSIKDPYMFTLNITGVDETSMSEINIYPNPTTIGSEINLQATCDKVEVFNALGVKVAEYHNVDTLDALETAGIYVIRVTDNNEVKHCRLVVK